MLIRKSNTSLVTRNVSEGTQNLREGNIPMQDYILHHVIQVRIFDTNGLEQGFTRQIG